MNGNVVNGMKLIEILKNGKVNISCELFPPKEGASLDKAELIVAQTAALHPAFISVTYGAGGGRRQHTIEMADAVQNKNHTTALAHLTCVMSSRESIRENVELLKNAGIENILALRGDPPVGDPAVQIGEYRHANELIEEIRRMGDFCIGGACYPEGHTEAESIERDTDYLKVKQDAGCEFFTTQMFFDNNILYHFLYRLLRKGIDVPVVAGVMPVTNAKQLQRIRSLSGTLLPRRFRAIVERFADNPQAMQQAGIAYATEQIIDLVANGVNNIHIYTMNKPEIAGKIMENLSDIRACGGGKELS